MLVVQISKNLSGCRLLAAILCLVVLSGCSTLSHTVGNGGAGKIAATDRQWYALWGLVPLNRVDGGKLVEQAPNCTIITQVSVADYFMNLLTGMVTVVSRTVVVRK